MKIKPIRHIMVYGAAGTLTMTVASALMSKLVGENFCEPEHLETPSWRLLPFLSPNAKKIAACGARYSMGITFASICRAMEKKESQTHDPQRFVSPI